MSYPECPTPIEHYCRGVSAFDLQQWQMAADSLSAALSRLSQKENPVEFKSAHYCLECSMESLRKLKKAEKHYCEVLAVDYNYKDALTRLERINPK